MVKRLKAVNKRSLPVKRRESSDFHQLLFLKGV
jgi:hypothetical protein